MGRVLAGLLALLLASGIFAAGPGRAEGDPSTAARVESAFRAAMQAWAADDYWRLWEMGMAGSRAAVPRGRFVGQMSRGCCKPLASGVGKVEIQVLGPDRAMVLVAMTLDRCGGSQTQAVQVALVASLEEETWRWNLSDWIGIAHYPAPSSVTPWLQPYRPAPRDFLDGREGCGVPATGGHRRPISFRRD
jgi:hypothetical protein